ncbi:MAG: murein biosynthesis integral membrane protein MurJ [Chloroflexi bacterium]|nr:murein biosynthesis integral membrane protein MurJ [Chloroflexota bacterium]
MTLGPSVLEEAALPAHDSTVEATADAGRRGLVRAAGIIAAGNVASRVLGLVRETVIAYLFGATGYVSAFRVAATLIQQLYDFLVGGLASAALVPVFTDYARLDRDELWRVASVVINAIAVALAAAVLILELFAPQIVSIYGAGYDPSLQSLTVEMIRLALPAVFFLGMSGVVTGLLYSLKRFAYPAFTTAAYNAGIVVVALALTPVFGITSLIVGIIAGSAFQVALQLPGLRDMHFRLHIDFSHPALRRIVRLYIPVIGGLAIAQVGVAIDRYLVSFTGDQSLAWMQDATTLTQFPLGLVATAISFAILPELSRQSSDHDRKIGERGQAAASGFQGTLTFGIKIVLLLILPAAVGLFVLARPIVSLLFQHGAFTSRDTLATSIALQFYLIGLPFAAIDQPLVFAFYANKNTLLPNLVAFAGVAIYVVVALALIRPLGMIGLVLANTAQLTGHALIMLWLTRVRLGGLERRSVSTLLVKTLSACAIMGVVACAIATGLETAGRFWQVLLPAVTAGAVYLALLRLFRVREAERVWQMALSRVRRV